MLSVLFLADEIFKYSFEYLFKYLLPGTDTKLLGYYVLSIEKFKYNLFGFPGIKGYGVALTPENNVWFWSRRRDRLYILCVIIACAHMLWYMCGK